MADERLIGAIGRIERGCRVGAAACDFHGCRGVVVAPLRHGEASHRSARVGSRRHSANTVAKAANRRTENPRKCLPMKLTELVPAGTVQEK